MRLFELRLPGLKRLLAAGVYGRKLYVWAGTRQLSLNLEHAPAFRPGAPARW